MVPVQIAFHGIESSQAVIDLVNAEARKLERLYPDIVTCRVAIERLSGRHRAGNPFRVRIELAVPGSLLAADSQPNTSRALASAEGLQHSKSLEIHPEHKDCVLAIRDAYRKIGRRLQDFARRQRGEVKTHRESEGMPVSPT